VGRGEGRWVDWLGREMFFLSELSWLETTL